MHVINPGRPRIVVHVVLTTLLGLDAAKSFYTVLQVVRMRHSERTTFPLAEAWKPAKLVEVGLR